MVEVNIGGKKRKFSFGLEVLGLVQIESGVDLTKMDGVSDAGLYYALIKYVILLGNKRELKKEGKQLDYTYDDVDDWLKKKGITHKDVLIIWSAFNESLISYLPKQEVKDDVTKKK